MGGKLPKDLEEAYACDARAAAEAEYDRAAAENDELTRYLDRLAERDEALRAKRTKGLREYNAHRPASEGAEHIKRLMRDWLTRSDSEARGDPRLVMEWAVDRFGIEYEKGEDGRSRRGAEAAGSTRYGRHHLRRLLREVIAELGGAPG